MTTAIRRKLLEQPEHILTSGAWYVVTPEESTNLVSNPSFELNLTGWAASGTGVSITRDTTESYYGSASMRLSDTAATGGNEYVQANSIAVTAGASYTLSFRYKKRVTGNQTGTAYLFFYNAGAVQVGVKGLTLARGSVNSWTYAELTAVAPATAATVVIIFATDGVTSGAFDLWIDGVQFEAKPYATTYFDGDAEGCLWQYGRHASPSYRPSTNRQGGRLQPMSDFKFRVAAIIGAGAAAFSTLATPYAQTGGGYYQGSISPPRTFTLAGAFECDSAIDLARNRAALLSSLNPLRTRASQPARLVYVPQWCGGDVDSGIAIDAVYGGGLEGNQTNDFGQERASLTFTTFLPFAAVGSSIREKNASLTLAGSLGSINHAVKRNLITGEWSTAGTLPGAAELVTYGADGFFYAVAKPALNQYGVYKWDGSAWNSLGVTDVGLSVNISGIAYGTDGYLYIGGSFASINGVAANGFARWNGSAWAAVGSGAAGGGIVTLAVSPYDGALYIGGSFTSINGVAANRVAKWDGSAFTAVGSGPSTLTNVFALAIDNAGAITAVGFGSERAAWWNGSAWASMGGGLNGNGNAALLLDSGRILISGEFSTAGGITAQRTALWNRSGFSPMRGITGGGYVNRLAYSRWSGETLGAGQFDIIGGFSGTTNQFAQWTGSEWIPYDMAIPGSGTIRAMAFSERELMIVGNITSADASSSFQIVNAELFALPRLVISGPGTLYNLRNWTNKTSLYFGLSIGAGETITVTLAPVARILSNVRGDLTSALNANSQAAQFKLERGVNNLTFLMLNTTGTSSASLVYRELYTSLDAAQ